MGSYFWLLLCAHQRLFLHECQHSWRFICQNTALNMWRQVWSTVNLNNKMVSTRKNLVGVTITLPVQNKQHRHNKQKVWRDVTLTGRWEAPPTYLIFLGVVGQSRKSASASELGTANNDRRGGGPGNEQIFWVRVAHLWTTQKPSMKPMSPQHHPPWGRLHPPCTAGWRERVSTESLGVPFCCNPPSHPRGPIPVAAPARRCLNYKRNSTAPRTSLRFIKQSDAAETHHHHCTDIPDHLTYRKLVSFDSFWPAPSLPGWERRCKDSRTSWQSCSWAMIRWRLWKFLQCKIRGNPDAVDDCLSTEHTRLCRTWRGNGQILHFLWISFAQHNIHID